MRARVPFAASAVRLRGRPAASLVKPPLPRTTARRPAALHRLGPLLAAAVLTACAHDAGERPGAGDLRKTIESSPNWRPAYDTVQRAALEARTRVAARNLRTQPVPAMTLRFSFKAEALDGSGRTSPAVAVASVGPDDNCSLYYRGAITAEHSKAFFDAALKLLTYRCKETLVKLTSPGGDVLTGIRMGLLIHEAGWAAVSWREDFNEIACRSSCAWAFMGGRRRYGFHLSNLAALDGPRPMYVYFHQASAGIGAKKTCITDPAALPYAQIHAYLTRVAPEAADPLVAEALSVSCNDTRSPYRWEAAHSLVYTEALTFSEAGRFP